MAANKRTRRTARRLLRLCVVGGILDDTRVRAAVGRVAESRRRGSLAILWELHRLVRVEQSRHLARIESAAPVAPDLRADIGARLTALYGPSVTTMFAVDPALIGGLRIQVGSDVYDGSIRARLATLDARLQREARP
jgi:F-type H+-transporting ATPase subunit delta